MSDTIAAEPAAPTVTEADVDAVIAALRATRRGYRRLGPGTTPALLVIDMQNNFVAIGGDIAVAPLERMAEIIAAFRAAGRPVLYATISAPSVDDMSLRWRELGDMSPYVHGRESARIHPAVAPREGEPVFEKTHASSFAGTSLRQHLKNEGVDTLVIVGNTTSGCVRATAVDAASLSLRPMVVEDAVFDQRRLSGEMALNDLAERYADVITAAELDGLDSSTVSTG